MKQKYKHWRLFPVEEWDSRWVNFNPRELSCRHCGEYYHSPEFLDKLQELRDKVGKPLYINSAHRCIFYNALVGGAPLSEHKKIAVDISLRNQNPKELFEAALGVGFSGFGFYNTFLHLDLGRPRSWPPINERNKQWL